MDPVYKGGPLGEPPAPSNLGGSSGKPAPRPGESRTPSKPPAAFEGELSFFSLPELIQLVCTGGHDSEIDIIVDGTRAGNLLIRAGRVFRCVHGAMAGEAAFFQLARLRAGRFRVTPLPSEGGNDTSLLNYSWQELLLEAARREDEAKRSAEGAPREGKPPETQRSSRPSDEWIDLFNSTPPPPPPPGLPRSDVYERVEERGQIIPFPRKPADDLIEDTFVSSSERASEPISAPTPTPAPVASGRPHIAPTQPAPAMPPPPPSSPVAESKPAAPLTAPSSPISASKPSASITSPSAPISSNKPAIPPSKAKLPRPDPAFIPEPPRSRPGAAIFEPSPESLPPLSLAPPSMRNPDKAEGSRFAQLIQDATAAYLRRDYEMALRLFEECLTIDPSDRRVQHNIERIKNRRSRA